MKSKLGITKCYRHAPPSHLENLRGRLSAIHLEVQEQNISDKTVNLLLQNEINIQTRTNEKNENTLVIQLPWRKKALEQEEKIVLKLLKDELDNESVALLENDLDLALEN